MMPNCFECEGKNPQCVFEGRYVDNKIDEVCSYLDLAGDDLRRYQEGKTQRMNMREMFATYLMNHGKDREALSILLT